MRINPSLSSWLVRDHRAGDELLTSLCTTRLVQARHGGRDHAITWLNVRLPDGEEGWVNQAYLVPAQ